MIAPSPDEATCDISSSHSTRGEISLVGKEGRRSWSFDYGCSDSTNPGLNGGAAVLDSWVRDKVLKAKARAQGEVH